MLIKLEKKIRDRVCVCLYVCVVCVRDCTGLRGGEILEVVKENAILSL